MNPSSTCKYRTGWKDYASLIIVARYRSVNIKTFNNAYYYYLPKYQRLIYGS